ncbi:MAG TPA: MucB/RseB C-terminal domain-containing protein [Burkholderiales bacterium]|jgi:sigma-E factor negative regulatory protein RseB
MALAALLAMYSAAALADTDAVQWLTRIQQSAQRLNYSGTFVYLQQGGQPLTSRITHVVEGGSERERLELLDGAPVVIVRTNEEVRSYSPDTKTVMVERRRNKTSFPALLTASATDIAQYYDVRNWDQQRVAGVDCQVIRLIAKDGLRYERKLWADKASGLLLKAQSFNEKGDIVEQIAFTQVEIGGNWEHYHSLIAKRDGGPGWRTATPPITEAKFSDAGWQVDMPVPGFRKQLEIKRGMGDGVGEVGQIVYSDGLASISVFLEPAKQGEKPLEGLSSQGAVNIFRKRLGTHVITVLGEAPPACLTKVAGGVKFNEPGTAAAAQR